MEKHDSFYEALKYALKHKHNIIKVHGDGIYSVQPDFQLDRKYYHDRDGKKMFFSTLFNDDNEMNVFGEGVGRYTGHVGYSGPMLIRIEFKSGNVWDYSPEKLNEKVIPLV